jgi:Asp-tRNA(Asn)/Glu-tRNA(Gln) amidotransferase B subunit
MMDSRLPEAIRARLDPQALGELVRSLATLVDGRQAGVPVSEIVGQLMAPYDLSGPERARMYVALRQAVRERVGALEGLRYVPGSL